MVEILYVITFIIAFIVGNYFQWKLCQKDNNTNFSIKYESYFRVLNGWLINRNRNVSIKEFFVNNGYSKIAIYGMGELGIRLYEELNECKEVDVRYGIDKRVIDRTVQLEIKRLSEITTIDDVDVIVVTPIFLYEVIKKDLMCITKCPIISLESIVFELQ